MQSKNALAEARQSARKTQFTCERAVHELDLAEGHLKSFRSGPLTAFIELQQGLSLPETSIAEAVESVAAEPGLKCGESAPFAQAVAWTQPSLPPGHATLTWAPTVNAPACADPLRAQVPI